MLCKFFVMNTYCNIFPFAICLLVLILIKSIWSPFSFHLYVLDHSYAMDPACAFLQKYSSLFPVALGNAMAKVEWGLFGGRVKIFQNLLWYIFYWDFERLHWICELFGELLPHIYNIKYFNKWTRDVFSFILS